MYAGPGERAVFITEQATLPKESRNKKIKIKKFKMRKYISDVLHYFAYIFVLNAMQKC